ncbi:MAG: hypothetical protein NC912_02190 [Candidatus Omnitrophica bacterium]|nr:hypothetical protein [Candidatus Omnitrophota bacterium]
MLKDKFFDRENHLEILKKRISDLKYGYRQNIAIIGDELIGKTSLIFKLINQFYDNYIIILYLEIRSETISTFVKRFIGVLLYNFLINSDTSLKEDLDFLIKKSEKYIPKTTEKIRLILNALERRKTEDIFSELLSLCELIHEESGKFCIIIWDEFHNLESIGIKNLYREWSKLLISQKNTLYIIISSQKFKAQLILSKHLSLLFGNFQIISVEPFDIKTSEEFIENRLNGFNLDLGLRNFIVHFTGGWPLYLELITEAVLKTKETNLVDILENLLFEPLGILNQRFSSYLKRLLDNPYHHDYMMILYLIASGHNKIKDISRILHKQNKQLSLIINRLLELDIITKNGDFLKINDRVFSFWLRFVYQAKQHSLTFDAKNQRDLFRNYIETLIKEFLFNSQKSVTERLIELLHLFENERLQIGRKKLKLSHFREIKPLEFNCRNFKNGLICRSNESLWILALKQDLLTEDDIVEFVNECKRYRRKLDKKIIITLQDIDTNAQLRALEEKILTLNLENLNQLFDIFYKPRIII